MPLKYMGTWGNKDPDQDQDYDINWTDDLDVGDTIATSVWSIVQGSITLGADAKSANMTKIHVIGGTDGEICLINNHCTTAFNNTLDGTMRLDIRAR